MTELIGVVAVIAIIAAAAVPPVIRRIDLAAKERERSDLVAISNALVLQILSTKVVPHETTWTNAIAAWTQLDTRKIALTPRGLQRRFMLDTSGWLGNVAFGLPYTQGNGGTVGVTNARILIVSSIHGDPPEMTSRPTPTVFNTIWNTPQDTKPAMWSMWSGRGEDLLIQRISLDPLFHRLVLVNRDPEVEGRYSVAPDTNVASLARAVPGLYYYRTNSYLDGTDLTLVLPNGVAQERHLLTRDDSFVFGGSRWGGDYYGPGSTEDAASGFAYWAYRFMKAGTSPTVQQGANPEGVVVAMYNFMLVFSLWADKCVDGQHYPTYGENVGSINVPEFQLLNDLAGGGPNNLGSFLSEFSGLNGILK